MKNNDLLQMPYKTMARGLMFFWCAVSYISCTQGNKDNDIKAMIATAAKEEVAFTGVNYTVAEGVVILSGSTPSAEMKAEVESTINQTAGVKKVINNIEVAPVLLTADLPLKQSVDSILMKYAGVQADVRDSIVMISGEIKNKEEKKLISALGQLKVKGIINQLVVK